MKRETVIERAAGPTIEVVRTITADQLDAATPCEGYSVRQLVNHLLFWAPSLAGAGSKEAVPPPTPAAMIGGMVCGELVVHGWDLARATDQKPGWDEEVLELLHRELLATAEHGRQLGVYGPEVAVPASASTLDRVLGLTGRDPAWPGD